MTAPARTASERRRHLKAFFDLRVRHEWNRYLGEPRRVLALELRERFLRRHLAGQHGTVLELGPGPGRFTPILRARPRGRLLAVDLSRFALRAGRRRAKGRRGLAPVEWVQAMGERLPIATGSVDAAVAFGNIVSFAALDGPALLRELARVVRPGGRLLADFASPVASLSEFYHTAAARGFLPDLLRRPRHYLLDRVLDTGYQPYAPSRMAHWEFRFYTAEEAVGSLRRAGFRSEEVLSVGPVSSYQDRLLAVARRDPRTWEALLRIEEKVGHRPGALESGNGVLVAAVRAGQAPRRSHGGAQRPLDEDDRDADERGRPE